MKKIKNTMNKVFSYNFILLILVPLLSNSQNYISEKDNILRMGLEITEKILFLSVTNTTKDTISIRNSYYLDRKDKPFYIIFHLYNKDENKYETGSFTDIDITPKILLDNNSQKNIIIPPKTKKLFQLNYWWKYNIFLEIQTIVRYKDENVVIRQRTNEIKIE